MIELKPCPFCGKEPMPMEGDNTSVDCPGSTEPEGSKDWCDAWGIHYLTWNKRVGNDQSL